MPRSIWEKFLAENKAIISKQSRATNTGLDPRGERIKLEDCWIVEFEGKMPPLLTDNWHFLKFKDPDHLAIRFEITKLVLKYNPNRSQISYKLKYKKQIFSIHPKYPGWCT